MDKFKGILICTDIDGTLLSSDHTISQENKEAIEYFKSEGGKFTVVTGRMPYFACDLYQKAGTNAPIGCINGGGVYDFENKKYLWQATMHSDVEKLIKCVDEKLPSIGIQINTYDKVYFCKENKSMERFRRITGVENTVCDYVGFSEPIAKIVFGGETDEEINLLSETLKNHPLSENFGFIRSEKTLYEILPKGIGKGTALLNIAKALNIDVGKTVAVGDYDNDVSMFKAAGVGIAVSNASPAAKEAADFITVSNDENAIARVICDLKDGKFGI